MNIASKIPKLLAKVTISAALVAFALRGVDIRSVKAQLAQADPATVAIAIVLTTAISVTPGLVVMAAGLPAGFIWLATWRPEPRAHTARTAPPSHS